jgi:hypothetical protein
MATLKSTLKSWFETDDKPSQSQFWAWIDSFYHKDEKIPITAIDDIENILNEKADAEDLTNQMGTVNNELNTIKNQIDKTTFIISDNGYLKTGLHMKVFAWWEWQIKGVYYNNPDDFEYDIVLCSPGKSRFETINLTAGIGMALRQGVESETTPTMPPNYFNEIIALTILVNDSGISEVPTSTTVVSQSIISGVTDKSPSEDAVAAALALKLDASAYNARWKGKYLTYAALVAAHPTGSAGDESQVNEVGSTDVINYSWDDEESIWVQNGSGGSGATNTDALPEGGTNLYWTVARFLANLTAANIKAALGISTLSGSNTGDQDLSGKQDLLVSGTNIKTVNGVSVLGAGDIVISGSGAKIYNVKDYGAFGNGITDDTTAIQNVINTVFASGGGVVYFPVGIYIIAGALQTSISGINYNSQLYIPQVNSDSSARSTISFLGEVQPNLAQTLGINTWIAPNSGVVLRSIIQGSGTRPSVICNKGASGNNVTGFSYTNVSFKNLAVQITPNGSSKMTVGGINCEFSAVAMFENVTCFPYNLNLVNSGKPDVIDIVGIAVSSVNCELNNTIINCNVGGFTNGFLLGEHVSLYNAVAICCVNGFNQAFNYHLGNYTKISAFWCSVDFLVTGASVFNVLNLQTEWTIAGKWYDATATLSDASNLGRGKFNYNIVEAGVGINNAKFIKIGGSKIKTKAISVDPINRDITATTYTFGATDTEKELITTTNASAVTLTLNNDSYYNFDIGSVLNISQYGAGQITIIAGAGNTIVSAETMKTRKQYSTISLVKISFNVWLLTGDLELI